MLTFPSLTEHGYNSSSRVFYNSCFWAVLGLAPVGYFFPLQLIWFSLFFVCRVILDCTLDTLNIRAWDFGLESSGECWLFCFSRQLTQWGSSCKFLSTFLGPCVSLVFKGFTGQADVPSNCPMPVLGGSLSLSSVLKVFGMWFRVRSTRAQLRIEPRGWYTT